MKEKKKLDDLNVEKLIKKTTVRVNILQKQEDDLKQLCKEYNIDLQTMKLPYREKIR